MFYLLRPCSRIQVFTGFWLVSFLRKHRRELQSNMKFPYYGNKNNQLPQQESRGIQS